MAIINLSIEAETPADLRGAVLELAAFFGGEGEVEDGVGEAVGTTVPQVRRRRTKNQMAADAVAATNAIEANAGAQPATLGPAMLGSAEPAAANSQDQPASSPGPSPGGAVTKDQVAAAMTRAMEAASPLTAQNALGEAGLPKRLSEMTVEQYPQAVEVLSKLVASVG